MAGFVERVAEQAPKIRPHKLILTLLAVPFYVLGIVWALVLVCVSFAVGAFKVGLADGKARTARPVGPPVPAEGG